MRIGLITNYYSEEYGGNEYYLARELARKGHSVFIYVSRYTPPRFGKRRTNRRSSLKNVYVRRLPSFGLHSIGLLFFPTLRKQLVKDALDVIHHQEWFFPSMLACKDFSRIIVTQRIAPPLRLPFFKVYARIFSKIVLKESTKISCLTSSSLSLFNTITHRNETTIIPNGVDIKLFSPMKKQKKKKEFSFLFVGRLSHDKGVDLLLRAFAQLDSGHLRIVGKGDEKENLENLISELNIADRVIFEGFVSQRELPQYYRNADVTVIPSRIEPFGFVTIESLACGVPVVGTSIGGMKDVIIPSVGIQCSPTVESLHKALRKMMKKPLATMQRNARLHSLRHYAWEYVAQQYLDLYEKTA